MVRRFRKKPAIVEVFQWGVDLIPNWFAGQQHPTTGQWYILTPEGRMYITEGDYIIKGVASEQYPCKPDIFEQTYQEIFMEYNRSSQHSKPDTSEVAWEGFGKALVRCPKCRAFLYFRESACPECDTPYVGG